MKCLDFYYCFFSLLSCGRICPMFFPTLVSWNVVWLPSLGMTRFLFVCFLCVCVFWLLLFTPISATFLNRSACDKFNADGFIFNHSKQKKINYRGMRGPLALKTFLDKQTQIFRSTPSLFFKPPFLVLRTLGDEKLSCGCASMASTILPTSTTYICKRLLYKQPRTLAYGLKMPFL